MWASTGSQGALPGAALGHILSLQRLNPPAVLGLLQPAIEGAGQTQTLPGAPLCSLTLARTGMQLQPPTPGLALQEGRPLNWSWAAQSGSLLPFSLVPALGATCAGARP